MALTPGLANTPMVDKAGLLTPQWNVHFRDTDAQLAATPSQAARAVVLTGQDDTIGTTPMPSDPLAPGLYRFSYTARVTTPGSVSSSLTVMLAWIDGGVSCSVDSAALTTNTTASVLTGSSLIAVDAQTPVSYSTAYAANAANSMVYALSLVLELVAAAS